MTFNIYLPNENTDYVTFFTTIEAVDEQKAEALVERMQQSGEIPEFYPY